MTTDKPNQGELSFGYANMVQTFMRAGLQPPPVPKSLRSQIFAQGKWCWGTTPVNGFEMYSLWNYILQLLPNRLNSYVAVSHAGHGMNSYGLQFALGYGPLVVFVQNGWGGVYSNHMEDAYAISSTYNRIKMLLKKIPANDAEGYFSKRVVLIWSDFRCVCQYAIQDNFAIHAQLERIAGIGQFRDTCDHDSDMREGGGHSLPREMGDWKEVNNETELFEAVGVALVELIRGGEK